MDYYKVMYKTYNKFLRYMYTMKGHLDAEKKYADELWHELNGILNVAIEDDNVSGEEFESMVAILWHMYEIVKMRYCQP